MVVLVGGRVRCFFFFFQAEDGIRDWSVTGVQTCALPICDSLAELDPENAAQYQERATAIAEELGEIDGWIQTQIATIPEGQRQLVTSHDAFQYYAAAYGMEGSEEHTSELQSLTNLVCRLLLEKKKNITITFIALLPDFTVFFQHRRYAVAFY